MTLFRNTAATLMAAGFLILSAPVLAQHGGGGGDVDNSGLPDIPEGKWLSENPYRGSKQAMEIGKNAYDGNCARCHGIDMISGGIAPDLRELGPEYDEYFLGHIRNGVQRNGMTYMPAFEDVLDQKTMWAIRSYIDKRHYEYNDKNLDDLYKQWDEKQAAGGDQPAGDTDSTSDDTAADSASSAAPEQSATESAAASDKKKDNASADTAVEDSASATVADAEDADRLQLIKSVGSIEIAMYRAFPPWSYQAEDGSFTGIDVEIGRALAKQLGVSLKARPFTPDEGMGDDIRNQVWKGHYLGGKPADAMIHVGMAPAFQKDNDQATFVAPYYDETMGFAYNAELLGGDVDNPLALAGKKIGVQLDSLGDYFLSSAYQGQLRDGVEHFNSVPEAMKAMNAGEVVAVMAPIGELKGAAKMLGESRMKMRTTKLTGLYQTSWDVGVAVKEGNPELAAAIKDAMHTLRESGELKKIFEQFGVPYRKPMQEDKMTAGL
ncbi:cytochrome c-550 PedF [Salinisphaera aquimarina]|uniref:Cytochrome c-550 PedF n=1 Tax=Salinisphaera aquimarina TaxID=2094031 RepID=A0ABV7EKR3_9GAMM